MRHYLLLTSIVLCIKVHSQNVGIGTSNPQEKLDVNGNININGTIKANGIAGTNNQVLRTGSNGSLEWANLTHFDNFVSFSSGNTTFNVPAGVTKVMVEVWGAGGGATPFGGGGGGGYVKALITVTPGSSIGVAVGTGGSAGNSGPTYTAVTGGSSTVSYAPSSITITAAGGSGNVTNSNPNTTAAGGNASVTGTTSYIIAKGQPGQSVKYSYEFNGTHYLEVGQGANGGNAGNSTATGGEGAYFIKNISSNAQVMYKPGTTGIEPGGGGAGGGCITGCTSGSIGANGRVIIWY